MEAVTAMLAPPWIPRGCHALALDGNKRPVDSLTSNIGHLLWSGILDDREAAATAEWLVDEHRLPEVFADFPRSLTSVPVAFPTASRPQAWASGAPLLLLTTLLHLNPGCTEADADLPRSLGHVALRRPSDHSPRPLERTTV